MKIDDVPLQTVTQKGDYGLDLRGAILDSNSAGRITWQINAALLQTVMGQNDYCLD